MISSVAPAINAFVNSFSQKKDTPSYSSYNGNWYGYLNDMANSGDSASLDRLLNYLMTENSSVIARDWTSSREDTQYQRLVKDMRAAGLNPYAFATFGANPISSASSGNNYSGTSYSTYELNKEKNQQNWLKLALSNIVPILGALIAAAL